MSLEQPQNSQEKGTQKNPFEGHPLRALNIERMKTEERLDELNEKMKQLVTGSPTEMEDFKKLNAQRTLAENSLKLIKEAIEKTPERQAKIDEEVGDRLEKAARFG